MALCCQSVYSQNENIVKSVFLRTDKSSVSLQSNRTVEVLKTQLKIP